MRNVYRSSHCVFAYFMDEWNTIYTSWYPTRKHHSFIELLLSNLYIYIFKYICLLVYIWLNAKYMHVCILRYIYIYMILVCKSFNARNWIRLIIIIFGTSTQASAREWRGEIECERARCECVSGISFAGYHISSAFCVRLGCAIQISGQP